MSAPPSPEIPPPPQMTRPRPLSENLHPSTSTTSPDEPQRVAAKPDARPLHRCSELYPDCAYVGRTGSQLQVHIGRDHVSDAEDLDDLAPLQSSNAVLKTNGVGRGRRSSQSRARLSDDENPKAGGSKTYPRTPRKTRQSSPTEMEVDTEHTCRDCGTVVNSASLLVAHYANSHLGDGLLQNRQKFSRARPASPDSVMEADEIHRCKMCTHDANSAIALRKHSEENHFGSRSGTGGNNKTNDKDRSSETSRLENEMEVDNPYPCVICGLAACSEEALRMHYEYEHPEGDSGAGPSDRFPFQVTKAAGDQRTQRASSVASDASEGQKAKKARVYDFDPDYEGKHEKKGKSDKSDYPLRRYPTRGDSVNPEVQVRRDARGRITKDLHRKLFPDSYEEDDSDSSMNSEEDLTDSRGRLRAVARILQPNLRHDYEGDMEMETTKDRKKKGESGYGGMYLGRMRAIVADTDTGNEVLFQMGALLQAMDNDGIEYQKPFDSLLQDIESVKDRGTSPIDLSLCSHAVFYGKDLGDAGWGCGYRNAQMMIAGLLRWDRTRGAITTALGNAFVPSISRLQNLIQHAWQLGFARDAAIELDGEVANTDKWIGPHEIQALFHSMRLECEIRDFVSVTGVEDLQNQVFEAVQMYFASHRAEQDSFVAPVYIQYSGHSRTVIGLETTGWNNPRATKKPKNGTASTSLCNGCDNVHDRDKLGLLILDPAKTPLDFKYAKTPTKKWYQQNIFCPLKSFKEETYQLLYCTGKLLPEHMYDFYRTDYAS